MTFLEEQNQGETIIVEIAPADIDLFNKLIEGYDNMALVTTLDEKIGKVGLQVASYAKKDILAILKCLPIPVQLITQL